MTEFDSQAFLQNLTTRPGVYRMLAENGDILYVGKAKNLRKRVGSYFRKTSLDAKTLALVARVADVSVTVTDSETEALLLEQSQIKEWRPPYNILFKDDKSYPYIYLSLEDDYPRLAFHRGARKKKGRFFGPFPSAYSVRDSINVLQKAFRVRSCEDSFYRNRSRPCLQYQIKRCSGPCCQLINQEDYQADVANAVKFLEGKSSEVLEQYSDRMDQAAANLQYEKAAIHRDQILQLRKIQEQQHVVSASGNIDVIFAEKSPSGLCVLVMFIRGGRMLGNKNFFPSNRLDERESGVLSAFLSQFYFSGMAGREVPDEVVVNARLADKSLLETALRQARGRKVRISDNSRGTRARWLGIAGNSAKQALGSHLAQRDNLHRRFEALQQVLELDQMPDRLECFDISHTQGEATVASCVVFDQAGPRKADYRLFNIRDVTAGDDYAAMEQALRRRYTRLQKGEGRLPDVLFIDGGKGQVTQARNVLEELQVENVLIVGVAKGPSRKAGLESLIIPGKEEMNLPADHAGLHLIQHIRDESHRFAITGHRQRRGKKRTESQLDGIQGIGPTRKRNLIRYFGSVKQAMSASTAEIARVEGISQKLAEHIYTTLHNG